MPARLLPARPLVSVAAHLMLTSRRWLVLPVLLLAPGLAATAAEDDQLVALWRFGTESTAPLTPHGGVQRDQPGPRAPEFPDFDPQNTAVRLDGKGARFVVADPGPHSDFDFDNGDEITIEAWVNTDTLGEGQNRYLIGKGRTADKRFSSDNQNWALRLRGVDGQARISFLFATQRQPDAAKRDAHWHRWTSDIGFVPGTGWHRLAVSYRFGDPESIRGWLNEKRVDGKWDMGGATKLPPVVDDDAVWIGSSMEGSAGNSFQGLIDEIAIFRKRLSDQQLASRFRREGPERNVHELPEIVPQFALIPDTITVRVFEGLPAHDRWAAADQLPGEPVVAWHTPDFLFNRLPRRYDDWGVRDSWKPIALLQAAAEIELPSGQHRLLLRARGLSRVWLDDEVVARTGTRKGTTDGHQPVRPLPEPPLPGHRRVGYGDQEVIVPLSVKAGGHYRICLETLVGGPRLRAEPGETLLAIQLDGSDTFQLLQPAGATSPAVQVLDADVEAALARGEQRLDQLDTVLRRTAAASQDDYWHGRHEAARQWVAEHPAPAIPTLDPASSTNPIDAFLAAKIAQTKAEVAHDSHGDAAFFQQQVLPILRDNCFRCHDENAEGGLQLTSREAVLAGGDSGEPAVVPHDLDSSVLIARVLSREEGEQMPPSGSLTPAQIETLQQWVQEGVAWGRSLPPKTLTPAPIIDDAAFLRRAYLDCWGLPPSEAQARRFLLSDDPQKRTKLIDELLGDERVADQWVTYWQDVLAENPNILKPSINNTGPFRYFIHESLRDNRPLDRMVTELVMLRGSQLEGGAAGFGMAADNDAPLATRSIVLASAFLGVDLQCARCHDSPYHSTTQQDLFALSAMIARKPVSVPKTSSVSPGFFEQHKDRTSLIQVTLQPGVPVEPAWPFASVTGAADDELTSRLMQQPDDSRERLAVLITSPANERFAAVIVNRLWKRLMGAGLIEPADDWEAKRASHPELLIWLSRQLVVSGYDMRHVLRLIMTSEVYQRQATGSNLAATAEDRFFAAPDRRRLTAEQIVDSLFFASGHPMQTEEVTFDSDGLRPAGTMISLGFPKRAWEFATLANERDRPSLALPRAQAITDVLEAFGWNGSRQNAVTERLGDPNVLQPGILANGVMASWITRASIDSELANLAAGAGSAGELCESLFLRFLGRLPTLQERELYTAALADGFEERMLPSERIVRPQPLPPLEHVSWSNHLRPEANVIKIELERRARQGDPPDPRLRSSWREVYEDVVWALVNSPEFVWVP